MNDVTQFWTIFTPLPSPIVTGSFTTVRPKKCRHKIPYPLLPRPRRHLWTTRDRPLCKTKDSKTFILKLLLENVIHISNGRKQSLQKNSTEIAT